MCVLMIPVERTVEDTHIIYVHIMYVRICEYVYACMHGFIR